MEESFSKDEDIYLYNIGLGKEKTTKMGILQWTKFLFWILVSQIVFIFPFLIVLIGIK